MRSPYHLISSIILGIAFSIKRKELEPLLVSVIFGVLIDFDHFILSRYDNNNWKALKLVIKDPTLLSKRGGEIFNEENNTKIRTNTELVSIHAIETILIGLVVYQIDKDIGLVAFTAMLLHTIMDYVGEDRLGLD